MKKRFECEKCKTKEEEKELRNLDFKETLGMLLYTVLHTLAMLGAAISGIAFYVSETTEASGLVAYIIFVISAVLAQSVTIDACKLGDKVKKKKEEIKNEFGKRNIRKA